METFKKNFRYSFLYFILLFIFSMSNAFANTTNNNFHHLLISAGYSAIPLKLYQQNTSNMLILKVYFGKDKPYFFLLDTGASYISIDKSIATQFNLPKTGKNIITGGGDANRVLAPEIYIPSLRIGELIVKGQLAYVRDFTFMKHKGLTIAGIVGLDFLREHGAIIDIDRQYLYLNKSQRMLSADISQKITTTLQQANYQIITLGSTTKNYLTIQASINHLPGIRLLLDTGTSPTILSLAYLKQLNVKLPKQVLSTHGAGGSMMQYYLTNINSLEVGKISWSNPLIATADFQYVQVGTPVLGALGLDWLQAHQAIIDVQTPRLYFKST